MPAHVHNAYTSMCMENKDIYTYMQALMWDRASSLHMPFPTAQCTYMHAHKQQDSGVRCMHINIYT